MRHGLAWDEWSTAFTNPANPVNQMLKTGDGWKFVLERPRTAAPDSVFRYSTGTSNLMGAVIYNLTGQRAIDYSNEHLFGPMDITDYHFEIDIMIAVVPSTGQVVIYWMAYEPETGKQQWLLAVGPMRGRRAVLEFLRPEGGTFAGDTPAVLNGWGDVELSFQSRTTATLNFFSEVAGVEGVINLVRITPVTSCIDP